MFPLKKYNHIIPENGHHGAFGTIRKHDIHTGVDLYCEPNQDVYAIESGIVIGVEKFTGEWAGSPWWNNTSAVFILGESGIILYGELELEKHLKLGKRVKRGRGLGKAQTVLKKDKGLPLTMLHMELYDHKVWIENGKKIWYERSIKSRESISFLHMFNIESVIWELNKPKPDILLDVTPLLLKEYVKTFER